MLIGCLSVSVLLKQTQEQQLSSVTVVTGCSFISSLIGCARHTLVDVNSSQLYLSYPSCLLATRLDKDQHQKWQMEIYWKHIKTSPKHCHCPITRNFKRFCLCAWHHLCEVMEADSTFFK